MSFSLDNGELRRVRLSKLLTYELHNPRFCCIPRIERTAISVLPHVIFLLYASRSSLLNHRADHS